MNPFSLVFPVTLFLVVTLNSQDATIKGTNFPVRDFFITNDSIFLIKERHLAVLDKENKLKDLHFIGGYGMKIYDLADNTILTVSNELRRDVSSVRFYEKASQTINDVYYYKEGNFLDFVLVPKDSMFLFSTRRKKIVGVHYNNRPAFKKRIDFELGSFSRKIKYENGILYCVTDNGELFQYVIASNRLQMLFKTNGILTDFQHDDGVFYISNIEGKVIKHNIRTKVTVELLTLKNDFVTTSLLDNGNLIIGTWEGAIYYLSPDNPEPQKKRKIHKKAIYRIVRLNEFFYSSSLDKTLKKWTMENHTVLDSAGN
ncbi:MAG: hypothetical protein AAF717_18960 [Bacteroidota bacterium]